MFPTTDVVCLTNSSFFLLFIPVEWQHSYTQNGVDAGGGGDDAHNEAVDTNWLDSINCLYSTLLYSVILVPVQVSRSAALTFKFFSFSFLSDKTIMILSP